MPSWTGSFSLIRPPSTTNTLSHSPATASIWWETNRIVRPPPWPLVPLATSDILPMHFFWKLASPTASTSSTIRICGSRWAATAKASRTYMPLL